MGGYRCHCKKWFKLEYNMKKHREWCKIGKPAPTPVSTFGNAAPKPIAFRRQKENHPPASSQNVEPQVEDDVIVIEAIPTKKAKVEDNNNIRDLEVSLESSSSGTSSSDSPKSDPCLVKHDSGQCRTVEEEDEDYSNDDDQHEARVELLQFLESGVENRRKLDSLMHLAGFGTSMNIFYESEATKTKCYKIQRSDKSVPLLSECLRRWGLIKISEEKGQQLIKRKKLEKELGRTFSDVERTRLPREKLLDFLDLEIQDDEKLQSLISTTGIQTLEKIKFSLDLGCYMRETSRQQSRLISFLMKEWYMNASYRLEWKRTEKGKESHRQSNEKWRERLPKLDLLYLASLVRTEDLPSTSSTPFHESFADPTFPQSLYPGITSSTPGFYGMRRGHLTTQQSPSPIYTALKGNHETAKCYELKVILGRERADTEYAEAFFLKYAETWNKLYNKEEADIKDPINFMESKSECTLLIVDRNKAVQAAKDRTPLLRAVSEDTPSHPPNWATREQLLQLPYTLKLSEINERWISADTGVLNKWTVVNDVDKDFPGRPLDLDLVEVDSEVEDN